MAANFVFVCDLVNKKRHTNGAACGLCLKCARSGRDVSPVGRATYVCFAAQILVGVARIVKCFNECAVGILVEWARRFDSALAQTSIGHLKTKTV